jgi:branched-subunit amino acid ABC-type transport system permease component
VSTLVSIVVSGLVLAAEMGLIVLSFSLTFRAIGFANFAQVQFVTIGAMVAVALSYVMPLWASVPIAMVAAGLVAVGFDLLIFRRIWGASVGSKMIISAGLSLFLLAVGQYFWGVNPRIYAHGVEGIVIAGQGIGYDKLVVIFIGVVVVLAFHLMMRKTVAGRLIRATADSNELLEARGISSRAVVTGVWFIAGSIAALGGALLGIETSVSPSLSTVILIPMFAAAVLGGLGSTMGAIVGTLVYSFGQALLLEVDFGSPFGTSWRFPLAYQSVLPFVILIAVLAIRPTGLFGSPENRA